MDRHVQLKRIERKIDQILAIVKSNNVKAKFIKFFVERKEITMLSMTDSQQANVKLVIKDKNGKPAKVDGVPAWTIVDSSICVVTPAADGMSALFVAVPGTSGETTASVDVDADLGPGVTDIIGVLSVVISLNPAAVVELQADPPVEQPNPGPVPAAKRKP